MIRTLTASDLSLTRHTAESFFEESGIDGTLNFDHFCKQWGHLIKLDMAVIMLYIDKNETPAGIIGGTLTPCTMTGQKIAQEAFWWVEKHLRGKSPAGLLLLRKWEATMVEKGAVRLYVGNLWNLNNEEMQDLYWRLGYKPTEVHYVKNV